MNIEIFLFLSNTMDAKIILMMLTKLHILDSKLNFS